MDEFSRPRPLPVPPPARHSALPRTRRGFLGWSVAGSAALLVGGGAGVGAAFLHDRSSPAPPETPAALLDAIAAERRLIADLVATTGGTGEVRVVLVQAEADHRAHLATLEALVQRYRKPAATSSSPVSGTPRTRAALRNAERSAAEAAAGRARTLSGPTAALLASISACEATHAELLS